MDSLNREVLRAELKRDEGWVLKRTYRCTENKLSAGCGRNLDDVGLSPAELDLFGVTLAYVRRNGLTAAQAEVCLDNDIDRSIADLDRRLPWWRQLDPVRQRVLVNMCFNMGIGNSSKGLLSFRNTLQLIRDGNYQSAARNMLVSKWARQVGKRADRLAELMRLGPRKL
ncbi:glycoside hydrolase family protein [Sphingomonas desiccabilis]|uniref:Lysozyme n=1 Tax=Sphingomonas desiccabilis TaxID=429134 RepID=A0A4Q2J0J5_9SPHN|nr:glycoside hydrolase family protein [Sphingomonas desiccabilis]MBB3910116.1 lysozyme [Sphingomonas desiccabilis]RXZ34802.1 lysozyme [Sphingomonas desiccabilis]